MVSAGSTTTTNEATTDVSVPNEGEYIKLKVVGQVGYGHRITRR
jgi:hypothetical protein